jgi:hypothetical protein
VKRRWLVLLAIVLSACTSVFPASPRIVNELNVTFTASLPEPGAMTREQAIEAARDGGVDVPRTPDVVEFGTAACAGIGGCSGQVFETPKSVWLIEWLPSGDRQWGSYLLDSRTGEILTGIEGP